MLKILTHPGRDGPELWSCSWQFKKRTPESSTNKLLQVLTAKKELNRIFIATVTASAVACLLNLRESRRPLPRRFTGTGPRATWKGVKISIQLLLLKAYYLLIHQFPPLEENSDMPCVQSTDTYYLVWIVWPGALPLAANHWQLAYLPIKFWFEKNKYGGKIRPYIRTYVLRTFECSRYNGDCANDSFARP